MVISNLNFNISNAIYIDITSVRAYLIKSISSKFKFYYLIFSLATILDFYRSSSKISSELHKSDRDFK